MHFSNNEYEVVVVGGGPVGLASAIQLGRAGIKTLLLERRPTFSRHSKAAGIHARTMEIYRQWSLADTIREKGAGGSGIFTAGWMTRLTGIELGTITAGATQQELDLFYSWSPELMALCGQDVYEPILAEAAGLHASVELRLGSEVCGISQDRDWVDVEYITGGSANRLVRTKYVIAADGVRSPTRKQLDIGEAALPSFGNSVNALFEAPLEAARAGRAYGLFWVVNGDTQGALSWKRRGDLWSYNFEAADGEDPAIYTPDRCAELIRAAVGLHDLPVKVISILHWQHDQSVTNRWRVGRVFLAGDAAHRFPPHGGFGMNSGVQDSQNLIWKLVARLRWGAGDQLLDTYEIERKPVAERNGEQCLINTRRMAETGWLLKDTRALATIEAPEGEPLRRKISDAIPRQREQFFSQGQQFGQIYVSDAVAEDGTIVEPSTVSEYRPTAHPGARAPHVWLTDRQGHQYSSIDLYNSGFTLFAAENGEAWLSATENVAALTRVPLSAYRIGSGDQVQRVGDIDWATLVDIQSDGAVLIRPDGHVGARWRACSAEVVADLKQALLQLVSATDELIGEAPEFSITSQDR